MRASAKLLAIGITWAVAPASVVWAGPSTVATSFVQITASAGQADKADQTERRREADRWLRQARQAMKAQQFDLAESYLQRAEEQNVQYDALFARFVDTPAKVRQDLERMRAEGDAGSPPPSDPYGAAQVGTRDAQIDRFPPVDSTTAQPPSTDKALPSHAGAAGGTAESARLLHEARRALAQGDQRTATQLVAQVKELGLNHPLHGDSPNKVETLIQQAQQYAQRSANQATDPDTTRQYAQFLMDQADGMLSYKDYDQARQLAERAQRLPAQFQPFERTPQKLLEQIANARREAALSGGNALAGSVTPGPNPADAALTVAQSAGGPSTPSHPLKAEVLRHLAMAQAALDRGDTELAKQLTEQAQDFPVPDSAYAAGDPRPWQLMLKINTALNRQKLPVMTAGASEPAEGLPGQYQVQQGLYEPAADPSQVVQAQSTQGPIPARPLPAPAAEGPSRGERLYEMGIKALEQRDRQTALQYFDQAWQFEQELDPFVRQQLKDKLTLLRQAAAAEQQGQAPSRLEAVDAQQQLVRQKLYREITSEQAEAERMAANDPKGALQRLEKLRDRVRQAEVDAEVQKQMLTLVDRSLEQLQRYIDDNRADIELNEQNKAVMEEIERGNLRTIEVQNEIAKLVEQFEQLLSERRYAEAEVIAKQAHELDPESPVVQNLMWKSRFVRGFQEQLAITDLKAEGFNRQMTNVDQSSVPFDDNNPLQFDLKRWPELTRDRRRLLQRESTRMSPAELDIQRSLDTKVDVNFEPSPLAEVLQTLSAVAGVNVYLDPQGLAAEGVTTDTPVTIRLTEPISLRSALSLILEPLHLSYVIQHEVLRVTSEQTRDADVYHKTYNVADLVIPIPNFMPSYNIGLPGAIREAHNAIGYGASMGPSGSGPLTVASAEGVGPASVSASVLAQMSASGMLGGANGRTAQPMGFGPGGMSGGAQPDFDALIELITTTIDPQSWDAVGGPGAVQEFHTNLSLVISQTQEVHEQIADLLDQLRRLQDLQVTIEVRFITLNDNFFERIGIDFDFDIDDNVPLVDEEISRVDDRGPSLAIGLDQDGLPTADLDMSFSQGSFGASLPAFGGFDAASAANFGFAILSDIEVFFLLQAAQGDQRSNVLQAPKVTLFNGQLASVSDLSQRPFVTSVIPVVGDFAAGHQPVIVVLSEGTSLSVQAVVSSDKRFVRLTLVPFFSSIGEVEEFTFTGKTTTDTGTVDDDNVIDPDDEEPPPSERENVVVTKEGTTVQLPTFAFTSVTTTVSVPDGGTILLGGIKRLSEGRNERGVPMLSKIPYINRLFKNVGIGRTTQSLMMMVTPRIIIQEEEEERLFGFEPQP